MHISFGTHCLGLTILGAFLVTVAQIRCLRYNVQLCTYLFLPTSKPEQINISHTLQLISTNSNTLSYEYSVVKKSQEQGKPQGGYLAEFGA